MRKKEIEKKEKIRAEAKVNAEEEIKAKKQKKGCIGCLVILGLIIFFVIIFAFIGSNGDDKKEEVNPTCRQAHIISQTYVKRILKSPSTAEFSDYKCMGKYPTYIVRSEVDSQNSFGAMIRNIYIVNTGYLGDEWSEMENWQLNILVFDGEVIYSNEE